MHSCYYQASILKIMCTNVVVCSLVGTSSVMFYEGETSPLPGCCGRRPARILQGKLRLHFWVGCHHDKQSTPSEWHGIPSELTHCLVRMYIPSFEQCKPGHACPMLLVRNWCCSGKQTTGVFPTGKRATKRKQKKRGTKTFRSERTVNLGPKSRRFLNQKVFVDFPFFLIPCAFYEHVEASTSSSWLRLVFVP